MASMISAESSRHALPFLLWAMSIPRTPSVKDRPDVTSIGPDSWPRAADFVSSRGLDVIDGLLHLQGSSFIFA
jgi:hypothetical protein